VSANTAEDRFEELLAGYLEDQLGQLELEELAECVRGNAELLERFLELACVHGLLRAELVPEGLRRELTSRTLRCLVETEQRDRTTREVLARIEERAGRERRGGRRTATRAQRSLAVRGRRGPQASSRVGYVLAPLGAAAAIFIAAIFLAHRAGERTERGQPAAASKGNAEDVAAADGETSPEVVTRDVDATRDASPEGTEAAGAPGPVAAVSPSAEAPMPKGAAPSEPEQVGQTVAEAAPPPLAEGTDKRDAQAAVAGAVAGEAPPPTQVRPRAQAGREAVLVASAGSFASVDGPAEFARGDGERWFPAREGAPLMVGDRVRTRFSRARIELDSGSSISVNRFTTIELVRGAGPPALSVVGGDVYADTSEEDRGFRIDTPHGWAVVLGTKLAVEVRRFGTTVLVVEGAVEAATEKGSVRLGAGQGLRLSARDAEPGPAETVHDIEKRLAWALGAPAVRAPQEIGFDLREGEVVGQGEWKATAEESVAVKQFSLHNGFYLFGGLEWRNYTVSARVRLEATPHNLFGVGLVGYWEDESRMLRLRFIHHHGGALRAWQVTRGHGMADVDERQRVRGDLRAGSDFRVRMELTTTTAGTRVRGRFWEASEPEPGRWRLDVLFRPTEAPGGGRAGFWALGCRATFSEVSVEAVASRTRRRQ
jgi:hypothetical protein